MNELLYQIWYILLSFIAGYFNLVSVSLYKIPNSHHTGNLTNLVVNFYSGELDVLGQFLLSIMAFLLGIMVTHFIISKSKNIGYGNFNFLKGLVVILCGLANLVDSWMIFIIAFLMGLQNAFDIKSNGQLVRTTHMTGNLTYLGTSLVERITGESDKKDNLIGVFLMLIVFVLGGFLAGYIILKTSLNVFYIGGGLYFLAGIIYKASVKNE